MSAATLPSVDAMPAKPQQQRKLQPQPKAPEPVSEPEERPMGYVRRRVDVKMPHAHAMILHMKLRELQDSGARLKDGTEVSDHTKAVLWILENDVT